MSNNPIEHINHEKPAPKPEPSGAAAYSCLQTDRLIELYKDRGCGDIRDVMVNTLVDQDKRHAEQPFPFMSLPVEVRTMVYSYAMPAEHHNFKRDRPPVWTRVSSQIRKESLEHLFGNNTLILEAMAFAQDSGCRLLSPSVALLKKIGAHTSLLRMVHVNMAVQAPYHLCFMNARY